MDSVGRCDAARSALMRWRFGDRLGRMVDLLVLMAGRLVCSGRCVVA